VLPLDDDALPARFGRFELLQRLGDGAMARVYRARSEGGFGVQRDVALKIRHPWVGAADPDARALVRREAQLGARLHHPHLLGVHDAGEDHGLPWLAVELVEGGTLADRLRAGPLPPPEALRILQGIAAGLGWLHRFDGAGRVHRDLKPANVLLHHGVPKIGDYGLATALSGDAGAWSRAVGTPAYMSPEQARGERIDGRSDLFALGAIAWELLTGTRWLPGRTLVELVMQLVRVDELRPRLALLDEAAPGLAAVVGRALRPDPADRWPDAETFAAALAALTPRDAVLDGAPTVDARAPTLDTVLSPAPDAQHYARLGRDDARATLRRTGGEARVQRLMDELPAMRRALPIAGDDAGWVVLAMAEPLRRTKGWAELAELADRPCADPTLTRRLALLSAEARGHLGEAVDAELQALFDEASTADPRLGAEAAMHLSHRAFHRDAEAARAWAERGLLLWSQIGAGVQASKALADLAMLDRMAGQLQRADERFGEALAVLESEGAERDVLVVLANRWPVLTDLGRRHEAHDVAARALALAERVADPDVCLHVGTNRAAMLAEGGYLRRALAATDEALARWPDGWTTLRRWGRATRTLWRAQLDGGDWSDAEAVVDAYRRDGQHRLAALLQVVVLQTARRVSGDRSLAPLAPLAEELAGDPRGEAELAVERAWRTADPADADAAMEAAQGQATGLLCEAMLARAAADAAPRPWLRAGLALARRTEHLLHAARFEAALAEHAGGPHRARAEALLRDLDVPPDAPAARPFSPSAPG
jgi:tetratricopeptide (TPR) repeat protein